MRLPNFIEANLETIIQEWEEFARRTSPGASMNTLALRDHAADILLSAVRDMMSPQTAAEQVRKSHGAGEHSEHSWLVDSAAHAHAACRLESGFDLLQLVSEYRALRASVLRLWRDSLPFAHTQDLADIERFNEVIDQSLTQSVVHYVGLVERSRHLFLAILGHDLRNPLLAVQLAAEGLAKQPWPEGSGAPALAELIASSTRAMQGIIKDLLGFAAGSLNARMPLLPVATDLGSLCREVVEEIRTAYPTSVITLRCDAGPIRGRWDFGRIRQVFSNLLGNAVKHGAGAVEATLRAEDQGVRFSVRNFGSVVPAAVLARVFDPFTRFVGADLSSARRGGLGLGLFVARDIVTAHGGTIEASSSEKEGTTFTVRLPWSVEPPTSASSASPAAQAPAQT